MDKMFFKGLPTEIDVRKLREAFGKPDVGVEITHEDVENATGLGRLSHRYHSVTTAWRKSLLRDHNIDLNAVSGVGFRSLSSEERISSGVAGVQSGARKQLRSIKRADRAVTDDPVLMQKQAVLRRYGIAVAAEAGTLMRQIEPPKPAEQHPRAIRLAAKSG